jgi:hypothetical protein
LHLFTFINFVDYVLRNEKLVEPFLMILYQMMMYEGFVTAFYLDQLNNYKLVACVQIFFAPAYRLGDLLVPIST